MLDCRKIKGNIENLDVNNEFISETLVTHKSTGLKKIIKKVVNR